MVQKVRHNHKEHGLAAFHLVVGNGRSEVRFAAAVASLEHQPPRGPFRELVGTLVCLAQVVLKLRIKTVPPRQKRVQGHARQEAEVASLPQIPLVLFLSLRHLALAGDRAAKVRIRVRDLAAQVARAVTEWALWVGQCPSA